jgi:hypothetical protein
MKGGQTGTSGRVTDRTIGVIIATGDVTGQSTVGIVEMEGTVEIGQTMAETDQTITETDQTITETDRMITETDRMITGIDQTTTETDRMITGIDQTITETDRMIGDLVEIGIGIDRATPATTLAEGPMKTSIRYRHGKGGIVIQEPIACSDNESDNTSRCILQIVFTSHISTIN